MKNIFVEILIFILCLSTSGCKTEPSVSMKSVPQIQDAQFDFVLTYELDGQIFKVEDTINCKYLGSKTVGEAGRKRQWDLSFESGNEDITLIDFKEKNETDGLGYKILKLYFYCGTAEYYMGEDEYNGARSAQDFNLISYKYVMKNGKIGDSVMTAEQAYEKYKIKLINWECDKPIVNQFES